VTIPSVLIGGYARTDGFAPNAEDGGRNAVINETSKEI